MNLLLPYLKAYAALAGAIATAVLPELADDPTLARLLRIVAIVATVVGTWAVPNLDPKGEHQAESVQPPWPGDPE